MNAIMNKTNNGKRLFAVVAVFAMLACCMAVAVPAVDAQDGAEVTSEPIYTVSVSGGIE